MEKLGMRREALFRKDVLQKGEWRDSYLYAILEEDWRRSREARVS
jgi:RimJ/RimL family protein N-acetyltransferase